MKHKRLMAMIVAGALVLAGCGGSDKATSGDPTPAEADAGSGDPVDAGAAPAETASDLDVCALFTQAEAEAALGGIKLEKADNPVKNTCDYSSADPMDGAAVLVMYQPGALSDGATAESVATMAFEMMPGDEEGSVEPVDGIDDAYVFSKGIATGVLIPHEGGTIQVGAVIATAPDASQNVDSSIELAKAVAANL